MIRLRRTPTGATAPEQGVFHPTTEHPGRHQPNPARTSDEVAEQDAQGFQGVGAIPRRQQRRSRAVVGLCGWASAQGGTRHDLILPGAALSAPPPTSHTAKRGRIATRRHRLNARVAAAALSAAAIVMAGAVWLPAAQASEAVTSFTTTTSTTQAGGHPDLSTSFKLASPGE